MFKRALVGTMEIGRNVFNVAKGLNELGLETHSLMLNPKPHHFFTEDRYTITGAAHMEGMQYSVAPDGTVRPHPTPAFMRLVKQYDLFVFVSSASLLPRLVDLPLLKQMGKTVIARQCGTEARDTELAKIFWDAYGFDYPYYQKDKAAEKIHCTTMEHLINLTRYHPALANKTHNARMGELFADAITSGSPSQTLGVRPFFQTGPILDIKEFACQVPGRRRPLVVHAPTSKEYKRSDVVLAALEELKEEGLGFDLKLLHRVPHPEVVSTLREADILIDDLSCGCGVLAYEGAASGCVVLGGHDGVSSPLPRNRPVLHTTVDTVKQRIKQVVMDVDYRRRLAEQGRAFFDQGVASPANVAQCLLDALERDQRGDHDLYPTLYTEHCALPDGEMMPSYLKEMTLEVIKRHGAHPGTDMGRMAASGLLPAGCREELEQAPRWDVAHLVEEGPFILTGPNATYGMSQPMEQAPAAACQVG